MDTGKTTTLIISLVVGVIFIASVMAPILQSTLNTESGNGEGSESEYATFNNTGGYNVRDALEAAEEYDLKTWRDDQNACHKTAMMFLNISGVLHYQHLHIDYDDNWNEQERTVIQDFAITDDALLFMGWSFAIAYIDGEIIYGHTGGGTTDLQAETEPVTVPLSQIQYIEFTTVVDMTDEYHVELSYGDSEPYTYRGTIFRTYSSNPWDVAYILDPNGEMVSYVGEDTQFYYLDSVMGGAITSDYIIYELGGSTTAAYGPADDDWEMYDASIIYPFQKGYVNHVLSQDSSNSLTMEGILLSLTDEPAEEFTAPCNVFILPKTVSGYTPPSTVVNGSDEHRMDRLSNYEIAYYSFTLSKLDGFACVLGIVDPETDETAISTSFTTRVTGPIIVSDKVVVYEDAEAGVVTIVWYDNGLNVYSTSDAPMDDTTRIYVSIDSGTGYVDITDSNNVDVANATLTDVNDAYVSSHNGEYACCMSGDVKYKENSDLSYGFVDSIRSASIFTWLDMEGSAMIPFNEDITTVTSSGPTGVTDNGDYLQFSITNGGMTVDMDGTTHLCNAYIVPRWVEVASGGGSAISPTLATVISIIPLIMAVGLVVGCIGYLKVKS